MKEFIQTGLITAFVSLGIYIISIIKIHGIRRSISDSNYFLRKPFKLMFEVVMWLCGVSVILAGLFIKEAPDWIVTTGGAGIFMVGVFSDFKRHLYIRIAHYLFAIGGFTMLGLSYWLSFDNLLYTVMIGLSATVSLIIARQKIWALEVIMSIEIFAGLLYYAGQIM